MMRIYLLVTTIAFVLGAAVLVRDVSRISAPDARSVTQKRVIIFETDIPPESPQEPVILQDASAPTALLDDPLPEVREDAVESLADLGNSEAIISLRYALSDQSNTVRRLAIEGLASIGSDDAIAALVLVLDDPDVDLRELTIDELADLGTETARMVLQAFLGDEDPRVRELAINSCVRSCMATKSGGASNQAQAAISRPTKAQPASALRLMPSIRYSDSDL